MPRHNRHTSDLTGTAAGASHPLDWRIGPGGSTQFRFRDWTPGRYSLETDAPIGRVKNPARSRSPATAATGHEDPTSEAARKSKTNCSPPPANPYTVPTAPDIIGTSYGALNILPAVDSTEARVGRSACCQTAGRRGCQVAEYISRLPQQEMGKRYPGTRGFYPLGGHSMHAF